MNIHLVFLVIVLCVSVESVSPFYRTQANRYESRAEIRQAENSGDEFHQHPTSGTDAAVEEITEQAKEYNRHFTVEPSPSPTTAPVKVFESTFSSVNRESNREHIRHDLADQVGYGFKFSSVNPHAVHYTIQKDGPSLPPTTIEPLHAPIQEVLQVPVQPAFVEENYFPFQRLEGVTPGAEINFDLPPPAELIAEYHALLHTLPEDVIPQTHSDHDHFDKGFSEGSGLRAIAEGSADRAQAAVFGQHIAAQQAAFVAKSMVAQSAIQSAAVAIAALAGKEVLVHTLQKQAEDARHSLDHEINQLELIKKTTATARHASQKAAYHVSVLTAALNNAQQAAQQSEENSKTASDELASQTRMVSEAKEHLDGVVGKLRTVHIDYEATKEAAGQASAAAQQAQHNAHAIGERASLVLQQHGLTVDPHYGGVSNH